MSQKENKKQKKKKRKKTKNKKQQQNNIFFTNYHKQLIAPFVIYADFVCITVPIKKTRKTNCRLSKA